MKFELVVPSDIPEYLDGFNRRKYKKIFTEYMDKARPFFDELEGCEDAAAAAEDLIGWAEGRVRGIFKTRKFCDIQYFLLSYLAPAAAEVGTEKALAFAAALRDVWVARHPDMPFECSTFEKLNGGFNNAIFGFKLNTGDRS